MDVYIDTTYDGLTVDLPRLQRFASQVMEAADEVNGELSVTLTGDVEIQRLNREFRGKDTPTDVLSFPQRDGESVGQQQLLGDIVISVETAARQAETYGHSIDSEIGELLFHGFLHLLGNDHDGESPDEWQKAEKTLLNELDKISAEYRPKGMIYNSNERDLNEGE